MAGFTFSAAGPVVQQLQKPRIELSQHDDELRKSLGIAQYQPQPSLPTTTPLAAALNELGCQVLHPLDVKRWKVSRIKEPNRNHRWFERRVLSLNREENESKHSESMLAKLACSIVIIIGVAAVLSSLAWLIGSIFSLKDGRAVAELILMLAGIPLAITVGWFCLLLLLHGLKWSLILSTLLGSTFFSSEVNTEERARQWSELSARVRAFFSRAVTEVERQKQLSQLRATQHQYPFLGWTSVPLKDYSGEMPTKILDMLSELKPSLERKVPGVVFTVEMLLAAPADVDEIIRVATRQEAAKLAERMALAERVRREADPFLWVSIGP